MKAYTWVASELTLVDGGPPTKAQRGRGYAQFSSGEVIAVWELAGHFDMFSLSYLTKARRAAGLKEMQEAAERLRGAADTPKASK